MTSLFIRVIILWFVFMPVAILNGIIRESTYKSVVGELAAHQISTAIGALAFLLVSYFMLRNVAGDATNGQLLLAGILLVAITVAFEFGFGHYIDKISWDKLLRDYNLLKGRVWGLFLLAEGLTPLVVKFLVRLRQSL